MSLQATVTEVSTAPTGSALARDAAVGDTVLYLQNGFFLNEAGGQVTVGDKTYAYTAISEEPDPDDLSDTVTLAVGLGAALDEGTPVLQHPPSETKYALTQVDDGSDGIHAIVPYGMVDRLPEGIREEGARESVLMEYRNGTYYVEEVISLRPEVDAAYLVGDIPGQQELNDRLATAEKDLSDSRTRLSAAETSLSAAQTDIAGLKTADADINSRLTTAEKDLSDSRSRLAAAETSLSAAQTDIAGLKTSDADINGRLTTAETDLSDSRSRLSAAETSLSSLDSRVTTTEGDIVTTRTIAQGKNTVTYSTAAPSGTAGRVSGDTWFVQDASGSTVAVWRYDGSAWTSAPVSGAALVAGSVTAGKMVAGTITAASGIIADAAISSAKISDLDVSKLIASSATLQTAVVDKLFAEVIQAKKISANEMVTGTITAASGIIADAAISSAKISSLDVSKLVASSATLQTAVVDKLFAEVIQAKKISANEMVAGTITAASGIIADAAISSAKISDLDVSKLIASSATLQTAVVDKFFAEVIQAKKIGTNELAAGAVTADKIQAGAVTVDSLRTGVLTQSVIPRSADGWTTNGTHVEGGGIKLLPGQSASITGDVPTGIDGMWVFSADLVFATTGVNVRYLGYSTDFLKVDLSKCTGLSAPDTNLRYWGLSGTYSISGRLTPSATGKATLTVTLPATTSDGQHPASVVFSKPVLSYVPIGVDWVDVSDGSTRYYTGGALRTVTDAQSLAAPEVSAVNGYYGLMGDAAVFPAGARMNQLYAQPATGTGTINIADTATYRGYPTYMTQAFWANIPAINAGITASFVMNLPRAYPHNAYRVVATPDSTRLSFAVVNKTTTQFTLTVTNWTSGNYGGGTCDLIAFAV